ncbi:MAG TPA: class I SAM-dependent methyltransferase [Opitutaceae bacterium]
MQRYGNGASSGLAGGRSETKMAPMSLDLAMTEYYARRAREYEKIYDKPERQADLAVLRTRVATLLAGRHVYEVACGTGYWTQIIAPAAASVFAIDYNEEVLEIAAAKDYPFSRVTFSRGDAFAPPPPPERCDGGLAAFWWSHVRRGAELAEFLEEFFARLLPGARVVLLDNAYVPGSSTEIARTDADGNTFQLRRLPDGSTYDVLKNFPDEAEMRRALEPYMRRLTWEQLPHYWVAWGERL